MATVIKKALPYQILFAICVYVPYLNNYELTFAIWSLTALFTIQKVYSITIIKQLLCFAIILALATVVYFFKGHQLYFVIRDITYLTKPFIGLLVGYQLCKKFPLIAFKTIVFTGFFIALIHLSLIFHAIIFYKATTVNDIRFFGGYFSDFEVYALIIVIFHERFQLNFSRKKAFFFMSIIGFSVFMYLARTNFIQFIILFLALKGYFEVNKKSIIVVVSVLILTGIGYTIIYNMNPKRNGDGIEALLYKIKIAPIEAFKTKINREDWKDFNDNYRSYENIMTVRQMTREGYLSLLFGQGIGSQIDLKQKVWLGDMELRYISILHNGFMTIFLKAGLLGLFIYLITIYLLFKKSQSESELIQNIDLLLLGTGIFLIFSNWVFMGVYNLLDSKSILIGTIICYKGMAIKSHLNQLKND
ncbi:hypothetical protein L1S35_08835 [Flavobacterium sp. AS60]|uniref:hypothetical protein n=1 Tax=Flavobacterium anseongense TaxID=2910677 RepID=UPI001F46F3AC|nr:hypothetical protein [Flavobacterium sp. AS60]MCF6129778.1 hypothetical protein [Flavobacterium sp. AS60]